MNEGKVKIADVGVARVVSGGFAPTKTVTGTPLYMAPEVFRGTYSFPADIYALGCILKELCVLARIETHTAEGIPEVYSDKLKTLCSKMLEISPDARPTAQEVLESPDIFFACLLA